MQKILLRSLFGLILVSAPCFATDGDAMRRMTGGVKVEPDGSICSASDEEMLAAGQWLTSVMQPIPQDLAVSVPLRRISLKKLDAEIRTIVEKKGEFADTVRYLGGLTSIQYVIAIPEEHDIILAGPGEGWTTDKTGNVIGRDSKLPVLSLEDFLTVFRVWGSTVKQDIISCSFDLTPEAEKNTAQLSKDFTGISANNAESLAAAWGQASGDLQVTFTGIAATSRFAKILAAADFKMKYYALGLEPAPVRTLPSYAALLTSASPGMLTRFYLVPEYAEVRHDSIKLTWQLGETKMKVLTEYDYLLRQNKRDAKRKPDRAATNWSSKFETQFESVAKKQPVFNMLKNDMHLALVAALIHQERLLQKANCSLPMFLDETKLRPLTYPKPVSVPSRTAVSQNGLATVVVCGGIEINPFPVLQKVRLESKMDKDRNRLIKMTGSSWREN